MWHHVGPAMEGVGMTSSAGSWSTTPLGVTLHHVDMQCATTPLMVSHTEK